MDSLNCVNRIIKGKFDFTNVSFYNIVIMHPVIEKKYFQSHPNMWKFSIPKKWTMLLFNSGAFRIMGRNFDARIVIDYFSSQLKCVETIECCLQSETYVFNLGKSINLYLFNLNFTDRQHILYEAELFPAIRITYWDNVCVNVFSSGKVIILGKYANFFLTDIVTFIRKNFC